MDVFGVVGVGGVGGCASRPAPQHAQRARAAHPPTAKENTTRAILCSYHSASLL